MNTKKQELRFFVCDTYHLPYDRILDNKEIRVKFLKFVQRLVICTALKDLYYVKGSVLR